MNTEAEVTVHACAVKEYPCNLTFWGMNKMDAIL